MKKETSLLQNWCCAVLLVGPFVVARPYLCGRTGLDVENLSSSLCFWALEGTRKIFQSRELHQGMKAGIELGQRCWEGRTKKGLGVLSTGNQLCRARGSRVHPLLSSPCQKNKVLAASTEINPYGNLLSDATHCRRFLFPIALLISALQINRGEKAIGSKNI